MPREVYEHIYQIQVPLPNSPLKVLNAYVIKGEDKSLLVDTGFNNEESKKALFKGLADLDIDLESLDIFLTHAHADHTGLVASFKDSSDKIYISERDGQILKAMVSQEFWDDMDKNVPMFDLLIDQIKQEDHPAYIHGLKESINFTYLDEGDVLDVGPYHFEVIATPGHTPGHLGLYEKKHKLYIAGDHILNEISPNISFWDFDLDDLAAYLKSLKRVSEMEIDLILPGHRSLISENPKQRALDLIDHHDERLDEIYDVFKKEALSVRDVASRISWNIRAKSWEDFPKAQKWFASSETMSHLQHLYNEDKLDQKLIDQKMMFRKK